MSLRQKAVKGVLWSVIESWGRQAISFAVFFVLARLLGPEAFGLVALATVFLAFVGIFLDQGFSSAIVQRQDLEPEHLDTAFWTNIGISVLLTLLCLMSADWVANLFKEPALTPVLRWLSVNFILLAFISVQQALFQRQLAFKMLAVRSLIAVVVGGGVGVTMALMGFGVWSLVGQQLTSSLAQVLTLWWVSDWKPGFKVSSKHFKELFSFGVNVMGFSFVNFFNRRSDDFLIGYFLGSVALGYYSVAYKLLLIMTELLTRVIEKVAMPSFSKLQQEPERMRNAFYKVTQFTSLVSFPAFLGVSALAPELVPILFGEQWESSIPVMQILSLVGILQSVYLFNSTVILAMGKPFWRLAFGCINCVFNVLFFVVAVRWGIVAVAAAYVIESYLLSPLPILFIKQLIHIDILKYCKQFVPPLLASLVMVAVLLGFKYIFSGSLNTYLLLTICILLGALVYILILLLVAPQLLQEIIKIRKNALTGSR